MKRTTKLPALTGRRLGFSGRAVPISTRIRKIIRECRYCANELHRLLVEVLVVASIIGTLMSFVLQEVSIG